MSKSKIEWTDIVINPIVGCSPISVGCQHCYARGYARRLAANPRIPENKRKAYEKVKNWDGTVHYMGREWFEEQVSKIPAGSRVFICSMGDLFHENVKAEWLEEIFEVMVANPQIEFKALTKRIEHANDMLRRFTYFPWASNIHLGVTIETRLQYSRIYYLREVIEAEIKYLSLEPLLGEMKDLPLEDIDWVIVGGETGQGWRYWIPFELSEEDKNTITRRYAPSGWFDRRDQISTLIFPHWWFDWARDIRDQCRRAGIPFFFKKPPGGGKLGEDGFTLNTPEDLKIRELPQ